MKLATYTGAGSRIYPSGLQVGDVGIYTGDARFVRLSDGIAFYGVSPTLTGAVLSDIGGHNSTKMLVSRTDVGKFGADPEVLVVDGGGKVIPAWNFLPAKTGRIPETFWDGFQAEFTITPNACISYVVDHIRGGLYDVYHAAKLYDANARLTSACVVQVDKKSLARMSPEHTALGCAPSLNVYPNTQQLQADGRRLDLRFAGFHVHIGLGRMTEDEAMPIVKSIDQIAGVCSVAALGEIEDSRRRIFYGRAGEYRLPKHGVEYRTLSAVGLAHPAVTSLLLTLVRIGICLAFTCPNALCSDAQAQDIINNNDVVTARSLVAKLGRQLTSWLKTDLVYSMAATNAMQLITHGAHNLLDMDDIEGSWMLINGGWRPHAEAYGASLKNTTLERLKPWL